MEGDPEISPGGALALHHGLEPGVCRIDAPLENAIRSSAGHDYFVSALTLSVFSKSAGPCSAH